MIDAMQIVLYANTDGRGFFNKAAADDSDRSLIEYLRGMVNIGENNESQYLRNQNFSSTIVLELEQTRYAKKSSVWVLYLMWRLPQMRSAGCFSGIQAGFWKISYRADKRCLTTWEIREYLQRTFSPGGVLLRSQQ